MIERAGRRAGLGLIKPHAFWHTWATALTEATGGNTKAVAERGRMDERSDIVARRAPGGAATTNLSCDEAAAPSRCSFATTISRANAYVVEAVGHTRASMAEWRTG